MSWRLPIFVLIALVTLGPVSRAAATPAPVVQVFVNLDEQAVLYGFRDKKTGAFPKLGEPRFEKYKERWQALITEVFKEIRKRVPRTVQVIPASKKEDPSGVHIDLTVADLSLNCSSPEVYKYLWVRTYQESGYTTNWDALGVRSDIMVDKRDAPDERARDNTDAWIQVWSKVPYLRVNKEADTPPEKEAVATP